MTETNSHLWLRRNGRTRRLVAAGGGVMEGAAVEEALAAVVAASVRGRELSDISPFPRGCGSPGSEEADGLEVVPEVKPRVGEKLVIKKTIGGQSGAEHEACMKRDIREIDEHQYDAGPDQEVDQIGGHAAKRPRHAVLERDVLGRDDFDARIELFSGLRHPAIIRCAS